MQAGPGVHSISSRTSHVSKVRSERPHAPQLVKQLEPQDGRDTQEHAQEQPQSAQQGTVQAEQAAGAAASRYGTASARRCRCRMAVTCPHGCMYCVATAFAAGHGLLHQPVSPAVCLSDAGSSKLHNRNRSGHWAGTGRAGLRLICVLERGIAFARLILGPVAACVYMYQPQR